jgi:hypothetical protein
MENNTSQGISTGIAMMNLDPSDTTANLQLSDPEGIQVATARLDGANSLKGNGHIARFLPEFNWTPSVNFSNFTGVLKVTTAGSVAATVLQIRPGEFATMPVSPLTGGASSQTLNFAQFGNGAGALFSEIMLVDLDTTQPADVTVAIKDDSGNPQSVVLNGESVPGSKTLRIPGGGLRILSTDGRGTLVGGSVTVTSNRPLAGVILFGGSLGLAGVGASTPLTGSFIAPMEINNAQGINTGIAIQSLETAREITLELQLSDVGGRQVASARAEGANALKAGGHVARFLPEFSWTPSLDFSSFTGVLRITASGSVAATVLQVRPGQLATMPVAQR